MDLIKYPRTHHIEGSRLQPGDEDLGSVAFRTLSNQYIVVEEKLDGANSGVSFDSHGRLYLQSRGHFLDGGPREKHFAMLKTWANTQRSALWEILGSRFVMYGEWLYAKHTIFYDLLPHYFMEFDILDRLTGEFLSTERRRKMLDGSPVVSVPVLYQGQARSLGQLEGTVGRSLYKTPMWKDRLAEVAIPRGADAGRTLAETDPSDTMEGLYIKVEESGVVSARLKYIRYSFLASVIDSGSHWLDRPIIPNQLRKDADIFGNQS